MKTILKTFFALLFVIADKIFINKNRIPNKTMESVANTAHSLFIYTSFFTLYAALFDIKIVTTSLAMILYLLLFSQSVVITRYFNQKMLEPKESQVSTLKLINKIAFIIFLSNWIFISFGFALLFLFFLLLNNLLYIFIIMQIKKQKEQAEFKQQFGEGTYSKEDILNKHILNLFEKSIDISHLTKSDIKKQYRTMAKRYHPDIYKGDDPDKFRSINSSYKYLLELQKG